MGNTTPPMGNTEPPMGNTPPPPPSCPAPAPRQLLINEVLANPSGNETQTKDEFVEVLNLGGAVNLQGITLTYNGAIKVTFAAGCLEGGGALAIFNQADGAQWRWSTPNADSTRLATGHAKFTLTNSAAAALTLKDAAGVVLDELTVPTNRIADGVSANRSPDATAGAAVELHTTLNLMLNLSPALCPSGGRYEARCAP
ncbi:MAG: lamin tail domain-containing protein [Deltaproteobacteria bacterium]|nr:lamin tail domain-containing protein [Deltaproteobacteria bacterium]